MRKRKITKRNPHVIPLRRLGSRVVKNKKKELNKKNCRRGRQDEV